MRNLSNKTSREIKTRILCSITFPIHRAVYEVMWKRTVQPGKLDEFGTPKATNTHSEYEILIAFPLQQWLHERASVLNVYYQPSFEFKCPRTQNPRPSTATAVC
jgi:hypothetical protein